MNEIQYFTNLIPIFSVIIGALIAYLSTLHLESRKQLMNQRVQAYADYMRALATSATIKSFDIKEQVRNQQETARLATDAKMRMCVYASPSVIRCIGRFEAAGANANTKEGRDAILQLAKEMRQDLAVKGKKVSNLEFRAFIFGNTDDLANNADLSPTPPFPPSV